MSDLYAVASTPVEVALVAATLKTVIRIVAPSSHRVRVTGWGIFFDGTNTAAEPVVVKLMRQTTAGTVTTVPATNLVATRPVSETILTTAGYSATVEPTASDVLDTVEVHPQQGYEVKFPMGQEIIVGGGGYLAITATAPAAVNCTAKIFFEE